MIRRSFLALLALLLAVRPVAAEEPTPVDRAIRKALPHVAEAGRTWIDEKRCVSCHRTSFTNWTLAEASRQGFEIDEEQLAGWRSWARESLLEPTTPATTAAEPADTKDATEAPIVAAGATNLEGVAQILWAERADEAARRDESTATLARLLIDGPWADEKWPAGGQLPAQKRPKPETRAVSVAWIGLALGTVDGPDAERAREAAVTGFERSEPGISAEWYAVRLLLAAQSGPAAAVGDRITELRQHQRPDGGWGWLVAEESDALATGMAVYALLEARVPSDDADLRRAVQYLVETQGEDGSWPVNGTKANKRGMVQETATYWGTCWATIALLRLRSAGPTS